VSPFSLPYYHPHHYYYYHYPYKEAFHLVGGSLDGILTTPPSALMVGLGLMEAIPEEIDKVDMTKGQRDDLQEALREVTGNVIQVRAWW